MAIRATRGVAHHHHHPATQQFRFADGTTWDLDTIKAHVDLPAAAVPTMTTRSELAMTNSLRSLVEAMAVFDADGGASTDQLRPQQPAKFGDGMAVSALG